MRKKIAFSTSRDNEGTYHLSIAIPENAVARVSDVIIRTMPMVLDMVTERHPELAMYIVMLKQSLGIETVQASKESEPS